MENQTSNKRMLALYGLLGVFTLAVIVVVVIGLFSPKPASSTQSLVQQQKDLATSTYADPILKYLPYGDIGYNITPFHKIINAKQTLVIKVSVILSGSDYKSSPADLQSAINAREQAALGYLKSKGFETSKYNVEYDVPAH